MRGFQDFYEGHLELAREHLNAVSRASWPVPPIRRCLHSGHSPTTRSQSRRSPSPRSAPSEESFDTAAYLGTRSSVRRVEEMGFSRGPFSRAFVKVYAAWMRRFMGDDKRVGSWVPRSSPSARSTATCDLDHAWICLHRDGYARGEAHREFLQGIVAIFG